MLRSLPLLAVGLALADVSCAFTLPLGDSCPASTCSSEGELRCTGNVTQVCVLHEGDPCIYHRWSEGADCGAHDAICTTGGCALKNERCPAGAASFCRDGRVFECLGDQVSAAARSCFGEASCQAVTLPDGRTGGVCALDAVPCRESTGPSSECRGNEIVACDNGFAVYATTCDLPGERCLERGAYPSSRAQCALDAPCPADGGTVCAGARVYGCEFGTALTDLRDCSETGEACATVAGRALCAASSAEPPRTSWLHLAGGSFVSGPSDPESDERVPVTVSDFDMLEREVTVGDYSACLLSGACTEPDESAAGCYSSARYTRPDLDAELPVTCVYFEQAEAYCRWIGGRVPTAAEWEYALRNAGQDVEFPWGDERPDCTRSIIDYGSGEGCGRKEPWPGCSRAPDRSAQGICDLVGNVGEWAQPLEAGGLPPRCGASYTSAAPTTVRYRPYAGDNSPRPDVGFRCVR